MASPKIVTSSWFTTLPDTHARIGISRGVPRGTPAGYRRYAALNPGRWFSSVTVEEYIARYNDEVLSRLDPRGVVDDLTKLSDGHTPTLLCFEKPGPGPDWCHRGIVSLWLHQTLGLEVYEFGQEHHGCGAFHPKLPAKIRARA